MLYIMTYIMLYIYIMDLNRPVWGPKYLFAKFKLNRSSSFPVFEEQT